MLGGIYHDQKKQTKKKFRAAFFIAPGVWGNLRYYGE